MSKINKEFFQAIKLCRELGIVVSELSGGVVVDFPTWKDFRDTLSGARTDTDGHRLEIYKILKPFFRKIYRSKDGAGRYHIWQTGTVRMDFADNVPGRESLGARGRYYRKPIR
ncbi:hypothetical protein N9055_00300 [Akkermansiaceae bacterium]|nr:hypothetical protein [Akkermansiaceae bacterium]